MPVLVPTRCAICGPGVSASAVYQARLAGSALTPQTFSARREPDRIHYRVVRCDGCGLLRSDPIADVSFLEQLYSSSRFDYGEQAADLAATYTSCLARAEALGARMGALLEIGCGNGFFLAEAARRGYRLVRGVEPSRHAIESADPAIRPWITQDVMRLSLFPSASFDVVCAFHVLDHVPDPGAFLDQCAQVLRPGGFLVIVVHDADAWSHRLLGERSPIVDVEHTYLYGRHHLARLAGSHGLTPCTAGRVMDRHELGYLLRLMPLPQLVRRGLRGGLSLLGADKTRIRAPLGNSWFIARRPGP